jgi:hypothetical protein
MRVLHQDVGGTACAVLRQDADECATIEHSCAVLRPQQQAGRRAMYPFKDLAYTWVLWAVAGCCRCALFSRGPMTGMGWKCVSRPPESVVTNPKEPVVPLCVYTLLSHRQPQAGGAVLP